MTAGVGAGKDRGNPIVLRWFAKIMRRSPPRVEPAADKPVPAASASPVAAPTEDDDSKLFDQRVIDEIRSLGGPGHPDPLAEVVEVYLRHTPSHIAALRRAVASGDNGGVRAAAHSLKSGSLSIGAVAMARIAADMEQQARAGVVAGQAARLDGLEATFPQVQRALERQCGSEGE